MDGRKRAITFMCLYLTFMGGDHSRRLLLPLLLLLTRQHRSFPQAVPAIFLESWSHRPVPERNLDDAFTQQRQCQTPKPLQEIDDLRYAAFHSNQQRTINDIYLDSSEQHRNDNKISMWKTSLTIEIHKLIGDTTDPMA